VQEPEFDDDHTCTKLTSLKSGFEASVEFRDCKCHKKSGQFDKSRTVDGTLCELARTEQDQDKLGALFEGILRLLEDQQARLKTTEDGMPHDTPALISN
jgi:hypothetical protein